MRYPIGLCVLAALTAGCASNPTTTVATNSGTAAPFVEGVPVTEAAQSGQPVALDVITTKTQTVHGTAAQDDEGNRLVCEQIATIGTRLARKVCKTQAQIAYEREAAEKATAAHQGVNLGPDYNPLERPAVNPSQ
jgi:hypothetical protein